MNVKTEEKMTTRVQKDSGTSLRADHTSRPRKLLTSLELELQDPGSKNDLFVHSKTNMGTAFVFIRKSIW